MNLESSPRDLLILGAGLSGLTAARDLHAAGRSIRVLDKAHGVSGRASTRRWDEVPVDHGAQFFTVRSPEFRAQVDRWQAQDICFPWAKGFHQWDAEHGLVAPAAQEVRHPRFACHAGMSALGKNLAASLPADTVQLRSRLTRLRLADAPDGTAHWQAEIEDAPADAPVSAGRTLVSTLPTPQLLALLAASGLPDHLFDPAALARLRAVEYTPTLTVLLRGPAPKTAWQGIQLRDGTLGWIGADTDKRPGGVPADGGTQIFVLHGSEAFSREWQDRDLDEAVRRLVARAGEIVGGWITLLPDRQVHRWRFANVPHGVESGASLRLSGPGTPPFHVAGDAFFGAKIEGAYRSGEEVAKAILAAA